MSARTTIKKAAKVITIVLVSAVLVPIAVAGTALGALLYLPLPAKLPPVRTQLQSRVSYIYDAKGNKIGAFHLFEQNIPVAKKDIPKMLKEAVISAEDKGFYRHGGVDLRGSARALFADVRNQKTVQGGSTITQQYVKNAYTGSDRTISRKIREAILASQLSRQVDKDEILYRYLSSIYFGDGAEGVGAAAQNYFRKPVKDLNISESAMLAGLIPAPTAYAPRENPTAAERKRRLVLRKMYEQHRINKAQYKDAVAHPIWLETNGPPPGPVTLVYGPEHSIPKYPYFYDYVRQYLVLKYGQDVVFRGGLQIQTTLDPKLQAEAEKDIQEAFTSHDDTDIAMASVEPQTGFVRAMVGGQNYAASQTNSALGGCPDHPSYAVQVTPSCWDHSVPVSAVGGLGRQPGSSWKTFVLAAAFEEGIKPSKVYQGGDYTAPACRGRPKCTVHSDESGPYDLKSGIAHSVNGVFARLIQDVGYVQTAEMAKRLGVTGAWYAETMYGKDGRYALGEVETSPLDMASAYGVFANRGRRQVVTPIVKIIDSNGHVLEDNTKRKPKRVIDANIADNVTNALEGVIERGTAAGGGNIGRPAAGKTGTNSRHSDAWFVGYTPTLSTAVWVGHRNGRQSVIINGKRQFGADVPTHTWARFMRAALEGVKPLKFSDPAPIVSKPADLQKVIGRQGHRSGPQGIMPGYRRSPTYVNGGSYEEGANNPGVAPPPQTTTTTTTEPKPPPRSTTTTSVFIP